VDESINRVPRIPLIPLVARAARSLCRNTASVALSERIEVKKKKLHIHRAVAEDSGMYTCLARNVAGLSPMTESYPLIVSGNETATIKVVPSNLIAKRGEPAALHCVFEDADDVQWFFKEIGPLEADDERMIFENGTLVIRAADQRDQGFYSCHGVRDETTVSYTVELQIACECRISRCASEFYISIFRSVRTVITKDV